MADFFPLQSFSNPFAPENRARTIAMLQTPAAIAVAASIGIHGVLGVSLPLWVKSDTNDPKAVKVVDLTQQEKNQRTPTINSVAPGLPTPGLFKVDPNSATKLPQPAIVSKSPYSSSVDNFFSSAGGGSSYLGGGNDEEYQKTLERIRKLAEDTKNEKVVVNQTKTPTPKPEATSSPSPKPEPSGDPNSPTNAYNNPTPQDSKPPIIGDKPVAEAVGGQSNNTDPQTRPFNPGGTQTATNPDPTPSPTPKYEEGSPMFVAFNNLQTQGTTGKVGNVPIGTRSEDAQKTYVEWTRLAAEALKVEWEDFFAAVPSVMLNPVTPEALPTTEKVVEGQAVEFLAIVNTKGETFGATVAKIRSSGNPKLDEQAQAFLLDKLLSDKKSLAEYVAKPENLKQRETDPEKLQALGLQRLLPIQIRFKEQKVS